MRRRFLPGSWQSEGIVCFWAQSRWTCSRSCLAGQSCSCRSSRGTYCRSVRPALASLRGAAAGGGIAMALFLSFYPITRNAGSKLLITTAIFGLSTIAFGLSTSFWFSYACALRDGRLGHDQRLHPQHSRPDQHARRAPRACQCGQTSSFSAPSNELGGFRAGVMAAVIGATAAVTFGGVAMVAIAVSWSMLFPDMRRLDRLDALRSELTPRRLCPVAATRVDDIRHFETEASRAIPSNVHCR